MSLVKILGVQMFADLLSPLFRERRYDIDKLVSIARKAGSAGLVEVLERLAADLARDAGLARVAARLGAALAPACRRGAAECLAWGWGIEGARARSAGPASGFPAVAVALTRHCNLRCPGCPCTSAPASAGDPPAVVARSLAAARSSGATLVVVQGGEPFADPGRLFAMLEGNRDLYFLVITNGTLVTRDAARRLAAAGNAAVAFTVLGGRDETDGRRGPGAHRGAARGMEELRRAGAPFGVMPAGPGFDAARFVGDDFLRAALRRGALFTWYAGGAPGFAWQVSERHPLLAFRTPRELTRAHPCLPLADDETADGLSPRVRPVA